MDKFDTQLDSNIDIKEVVEETTTSRHKYILYVVLFVIFIILVIWVIRVLLTNESPLLVLNEMLNSTLQIKAASD